MVEPTDAVMPVLRKMQEEMARGFKRIEAKINDVAESLLELRDDVSTMNCHMSHHMGMSQRHRSDFEDLRDEVSTLKSRVDALEGRS